MPGLLLARRTPGPFVEHLEDSARAEDAVEGRLENVVAGSDPVEVVEDRRDERLVGDRSEHVGGGGSVEGDAARPGERDVRGEIGVGAGRPGATRTDLRRPA